jgi:predicted Zn-dependent peptidase
MSNLVAVTIFVKAGSAEENLNDAGIGTLVANALLTSTSNENADTLSTAIGNIGGNVKAIWQPDLTQIRALVLPTQFTDAAYVLSDVLKNADFPDASVADARQDVLSRIQQRSNDVFNSTNDRMLGGLFVGTPYALPQLGTPQSLKKLTRADLLTYFHRYYRPDNILISVVGNINPRSVEAAFNDDLDDFVRPPSSHVAPFVVPTPSTAAEPLVLKNYRGDVTADLMIAGYLAPGAGTPDYPAMVVANALLGGMKTSLMFKNLRTKKKLGYELASTYAAQMNVSDVTAYILYAPTVDGPGQKGGADQTPAVKDLLIQQFKLLYTDPPSDADLARAKKFVIGSYLLAHERIEDRSYYLGYSEIACSKLGGYLFDTKYADAINSVTSADIVRVAKEYFSGQPVISLLLPGDPSAGVKSY